MKHHEVQLHWISTLFYFLVHVWKSLFRFLACGMLFHLEIQLCTYVIALIFSCCEFLVVPLTFNSKHGNWLKTLFGKSLYSWLSMFVNGYYWDYQVYWLWISPLGWHFFCGWKDSNVLKLDVLFLQAITNFLIALTKLGENIVWKFKRKLKSSIWKK
jgi:hypothetical protein